MSTLKQIIIITLVGFIIYNVMKLDFIKNISIPYFTKPKTVEKMNVETKEEGTLQLTSPTLNPMEVKQIIRMKNSLINPYTAIHTQPNNNQYQNLSDLDFKNLQAYLANLLQDITIDGMKFKIVPSNITPNVYVALTSNLAYLTPIELQGSLMINNKQFGNINLMIILRGSTNSIFVPKNGVFVNGKKYEMYVENLTITSVVKNNSPVQKQKGFYATADSIDMRITGDKQPENKTPQEIKLDRIKDNPLTTFSQLEDSEEDFNLSEIIRNDNTLEPDSENMTSAIDISY